MIINLKKKKQKQKQNRTPMRWTIGMKPLVTCTNDLKFRNKREIFSVVQWWKKIFKVFKDKKCKAFNSLEMKNELHANFKVDKNV